MTSVPAYSISPRQGLRAQQGRATPAFGAKMIRPTIDSRLGRFLLKQVREHDEPDAQKPGARENRENDCVGNFAENFGRMLQLELRWVFWCHQHRDTLQPADGAVHRRRIKCLQAGRRERAGYRYDSRAESIDGNSDCARTGVKYRKAVFREYIALEPDEAAGSRWLADLSNERGKGTAS